MTAFAQRFSLAGKRALITGSTQGIGQALALGLAEAGARVILNGRDEARMTRAVEALAARVRARTPAGRWGRAEDLIAACVFLCSSGSDFVNGQVLTIDGGLSAVI